MNHRFMKRSRPTMTETPNIRSPFKFRPYEKETTTFFDGNENERLDEQIQPGCFCWFTVLRAPARPASQLRLTNKFGDTDWNLLFIRGTKT